jgi:hypothetical protein
MTHQALRFYGFAPNVLQPLWVTQDGLRVLASVERKPDGRDWMHASYSRADRVPSYDDGLLVRRVLFRAEAVVVAVFPPEAEHCNDHPYCLHLWTRIDALRLIPDLRVTDHLGTGV